MDEKIKNLLLELSEKDNMKIFETLCENCGKKLTVIKSEKSKTLVYHCAKCKEILKDKLGYVNNDQF